MHHPPQPAVMLLCWGTMLFWEKAEKRSTQGTSYKSLPGDDAHGPGWVPGAGWVPPRHRALSRSLYQTSFIWLHGKKILNKENKPCTTNPGAVSSAQVSNGFSTPFPALGPSSVTPRPSLLFQGWDGEVGMASPPGSVAGKAPSCLFMAALLLLPCMPEQTRWGWGAVRRFCCSPRASRGEAQAGLRGDGCDLALGVI